MMHSISKYVNGHSDVLMGSVALNDPTLAADIKNMVECEISFIESFSEFIYCIYLFIYYTSTKS